MEVMMEKRRRQSKEEHVEDIEMKVDVKKRRQQNECILPAEIIVHEILPWVPLKALFRFKLVCKEWYKVISTDSFFKTTQSQRCASLSPVGIIYHGDKNYILLPTTIGKEPVGLLNLSLEKYKVMCDRSHSDSSYHSNHDCNRSLLASSNGLLCGSYFRARTEYFYVSNPITQEIVSIPNTNKLQDITLAFEPSTHNPYYVLVAKKVVKIDFRNRITDVGFTVYSSNLSVWKVADAIARISRPCFGTTWLRKLSRSVFTGGKLYWKLAEDVLWFDIKEDIAGVVALPDKKMGYPDGEIGDCNGVLSYTEISASEDIVIWVLTSNRTTEFMWVKKYCLSLTRIVEDKTKVTCPCYHTMMGLKKNLSFSSNYRRPLPYEGGDALMIWVKMGKDGIILRYDMKTGSLHLYYKSEMQWFEGPLLSYKTSVVSLPKQCNSLCSSRETNNAVYRDRGLEQK